MPCLTILPLEKNIAVQSGATLLDAIRQAGIGLPAPCNGHGICGKCKVRILDPFPDADNRHGQLSADELAAGIRPACRVVIRGDMRVALLDDDTQDTRILEGPLLRRSRIAPAADIRKDNRRATLHYLREPPVPLIDWRPRFSPKGLAVDLGTTTLVVTLLDLQTASELATVSAVNPQTRFGHDVMTRIQMASTGQGLTRLAMLIAGRLNTLVAKACRDSGAHPCEIVDAVIGGNPTMLQIAATIDPSPLGTVPFTVGIESGQALAAGRFGLNLNPQARVYIPPVANAFVGSDISAGLLSIDFFEHKEPLLFIDMGTNGELALTDGDRYMVTSTAAGPAFEGMGISHGMRASAGAIEMVCNSGRHLTIRTIDGVPAKGICGSGIIDIVACLLRLGAVDPGGRMRNPRQEQLEPGPLWDRFEILDGISALKMARNVYFTQKDIREFQLAKSAIRTGIDMLLAAAGLEAGQLKHIVIAGAFGYHLKAKSLRQTGIIPGHFDGRVEFRGNTCRTGCALMLTDASSRSYIQDRMQQVTHLALAQKPEFQSRFIENMSFEEKMMPV